MQKMITKTSRMAILFLFLILVQNAAMSQRLKTGEKAPDFEVTDPNGAIVKLKDYKGQKVFLAFFRYAGCPVCNSRVHELIQSYDSIRLKGYKIIAVYESDNETLKEYLTETPAPFPVIGDQELKLYKKYGVEKSFARTLGSAFKRQPKAAMKRGSNLFTKKYKRDGSLSRIPADFLIDENGILRKAHYGKNIGDHLPLSVILNN